MSPRGAHIWILALAIGCSGGGHQIEIGPAPAKRTTGTLSGPLCQYDSCTCAKTEADAGVPDGDSVRKRFEIRLRSAQELWFKMPGDTMLYKTVEKPEVCFYVDLAPGEHPVELRASNKGGVSAEVVVRELGTRTKSFYDTFRFECGHPGACSFEELDGMRTEYAQYKRGLHDACGTTRIKGIAWDHGKAPDGTHPSELLVRATLDVYKFAAWKMHGDETCGEGGGRGPGEEAAPADEPAADAPAP
ncbi:MAG: hypothetical protein JWP01_1646 [Myxococcales bacterium]|nr:hypothetical protein [Myxococcales bacterium]